MLKNNKAQISIFVIVAIIIVGAILAYSLSTRIYPLESISPELKPAYDNYLSCITKEAKAAIDLAESQGGFIEVPEYNPGSEYAPFSSQLNFFGFTVPYWYYLTNNGLIKEQVPTKKEIENQIAKYIGNRINDCNFEDFYNQGISLNFSTPKVEVDLADTSLKVEVSSPITISKEEKVTRKSSHLVEINTKLGRFHNLAMDIYQKQKKEAFLENFSVDILRLYAPVDGVELSCGPKIWKTQEVFSNIQDGLEANLAFLKLKGKYYTIQNRTDEYFVINKETNEAVRFLYSKAWPNTIEITGAENELMIANPIGQQEGLGILGFCYAPYHFIYDLRFPVMIQIYDNEEIFQFPVVVILDKNVPRKAIFSELDEEEDFDLCEYKTQDIEVNIYDSSLKKINANISYNCFNQECSLGQALEGKFIGKAPACLNGYIIAESRGYTDKKEPLSTNSESTADLILDKEHNIKLDIKLNNKDFTGTAILNFKGEKTITIAYPEVKSIDISEGFYNITLQIYSNSSITIPQSIKTQCTETSASSLAGIFGITKEKCFDITLPETKIEYALIGGGITEEYLLEYDLEKQNLIVYADSLESPTSLEKLQYNYEIFESKKINLEFK